MSEKISVLHVCDHLGWAGSRMHGVKRLFAPGEPEWAKRQDAAGRVMLSPAVAETLLRLAKELRVPADALKPSENYERT